MKCVGRTYSRVHEEMNEWMQAGLKTGMYYLRTRAAADAIKFTVDQQALAKNKAARAAAAPKGLAATAATEPLKVNSPPLLTTTVDSVCLRLSMCVWGLHGVAYAFETCQLSQACRC